MRLFSAVKLDKNAADSLSVFQLGFKKASLSGTFVLKSNYHITIKFFGEKNFDDMKLLSRGLKKAADKISSFTLSSGEPGIFRGSSGYTLWLGIGEGKENMWELFDIVEDELSLLGIPKEEKPFRSHITMGRRVKFRDRFRFIADDIEPVSFSFPAKGISLMESVRERGVLIYRELDFFPFGGAKKEV